MKKLRLAVWSSSEGTTFEAIAKGCLSGKIPADCCLLVTNRAEAGCVRRARSLQIKIEHVDKQKKFMDGDQQAHLALQSEQIDFVALAGFTAKVGPLVLAAFRQRIVNSHPSLLPKFGGPGMYGLHVHKAVLAAGEKETGVTVHFVTDEYDSGPIVAQCKIAVQPGDSPETLQVRVKQMEAEFYVETLAHLLGER